MNKIKMNLNDDLVIIEKRQMYMQSLGEFTADDFVVTKKTITPVSDTLKIIKLARTDIVTRRKLITKPLDDAKKAAMQQEHLLIDPMIEMENKLKQKVNVYLAEIRREQEEEARRLKEEEIARVEKEQRELEEQAELNQSDLALEDAIKKEEEIEIIKESPIIAIKTSHKTAFSGVHTRKKSMWKLDDITKVPKELLIINEKEVNALVRAGRKEIPGIKIWEETTVVSK